LTNFPEHKKPRSGQSVTIRWLQNGAVLIICATMAVAMTQPLTAKLSTHLIRSRDTLVHYWNGWWTREALSEGLPLTYTNYLFYPTGVSLIYHNIGWLNVAAWLVLQLVMDGVAAYNATLLFYLTLCGIAAFFLIRELTDDALAGLLGMVVYQNWPARLSRLNFPNLVNTACIPLSLLFLIRTLRRGKWADGLLTGVFVALTAYGRWQALIPATIVIGIYLGFAGIRQFLSKKGPNKNEAIRQRWTRSRHRALPLVAAGLVVVLALLPPAAVLIGQQRSTPTSLIEEESEESKETDLLAYLTPGENHPVLGRYTAGLHSRYYRDAWDHVSYVGVIPIALGLLALRKEGRAAAPWATAAAALLLLGLGPVLRINGQGYPNLPTLYGLIDRIVPLSLIRVPARFDVFLALPAAVLAGYGVKPMLSWARKKVLWAPVLVTLILGSIVIFEYLPGPIEMQRQRPSSYYAWLAAEPEAFGVLNVPIREQSAKVYMFDQTQHGHPMMQGHVSRLPDEAYSTIMSHPWLDVLRQSEEMAPQFTDVSRQLRSLGQIGVKVILLQKSEVAEDRIAHWKRYLIAEPFYEDTQLAAYSTEPEAERDFFLTDELMPGLGPVRVITSTACVNSGGVLEVDVAWGTTAPQEQAFDVALTLETSEGDVSERWTFPLSPDWPTSEWPAHALVWGYYPLSVPPSVPTGTYALRLNLIDQTTGDVQAQGATLGTVAVTDQLCVFPTPPGATKMNAVFDSRLRLLGYEVKRDGDYLLVKLYWRSDQRMNVDYKVFVHVFDPETTRPVAQDDSRPHRGAYPTNLWGPGEVMEDPIPISLAEAPPGTYGLAVGVYDPATMERLPVTTSKGCHADGRLELTGETVVIETEHQRGP
jgi:hypothetical protein